MKNQPPLPSHYAKLTDAELTAAIGERKKALGRRLVILGHHYQRDEVIQFADFVGDSLKLAQVGGAQADAEFIVFCGVHFMAESADILTPPSVSVILPDLGAGCSMADMAERDQLEDAWRFFAGECEENLIPVTYVNSLASIKAFCGANGGACCTSGNARAVLEWAFRQGGKVLFLPDQHLGRNTAYAMGITLDEMALFDPALPNGGLTAERVRAVKVLLWKGYCDVHGLFTVQQCEDIRRNEPDRKIIVHPECAWEVVQQVDLAGSTEFIIKTVKEAPSGSKWAIGTETNLVERLRKTFPDQSVMSLAGIQCLCTTMGLIDLRHLLWVLDELAGGNVVNRITVKEDTRQSALVALDRMLANVPAAPAAIK